MASCLTRAKEICTDAEGDLCSSLREESSCRYLNLEFLAKRACRSTSRVPTNESKKRMRFRQQVAKEFQLAQRMRSRRARTRAMARALERDEKHDGELLEPFKVIESVSQEEDTSPSPTVLDVFDDSLWQEMREDSKLYLELDDLSRCLDALDEQGAQLEHFSNLHVLSTCPVCMEDKELLLLGCKHEFCMECLFEQLEARWPGPRITFSYMNCGLCRERIAHDELVEILSAHSAFLDKVASMAEQKFCADGLDQELTKNLGRAARQDELRDQAEKDMAMYMCGDCRQPYCGGRVDCAQQQEIVAENLCCQGCEWAKLSSADDHRCMIHGHTSAIYKCDSCCSVATWNCGEHHYCERCHRDPWQAKQYPCPGPGLCPLGIPHPRNVEANLTTARNSNVTHKSFVLGCTACLGFDEEANYTRPHENEANQFGFSERDWSSLSSGAEVLALIGKKEVHERLRLKRPAVPQGGSAAECAERLLLHEQGILTAGALVGAAERLARQESTVASGGQLLTQRLVALGLPGDGTLPEKARRLLMVRTVSVQAMLWAAASGFPTNIAAAVSCLPAGQADTRCSLDVCLEAESQEHEAAVEISWFKWRSANNTLNVKDPSCIASRESSSVSRQRLQQLPTTKIVQPNGTCNVEHKGRRLQRAVGVQRQRARDKRSDICDAC